MRSSTLVSNQLRQLFCNRNITHHATQNTTHAGNRRLRIDDYASVAEPAVGFMQPLLLIGLPVTFLDRYLILQFYTAGKN